MGDYNRETGSHLTQLGDPKTGQVLEYFLHYMTKKTYPVHKRTEIASYYFFKFCR